MIDINMYQDVLQKYSITDCAVRKKGIYVFIVSEILTDEELDEYEEQGLDLFYRPKKIVTFIQDGDPSQNGRQWFKNHLIGWDTPKIGACNKPRNHSITTEIATRYDKHAYITGSGPAGEIPYPPRVALRGVELGGFIRGGVSRIKTIDGWAYAVGSNRTLGRFLDKDKWETLNKNLPEMELKESDLLSTSGFEDVDGFSETDIYAAGGKGDVWHFDGENWEPIPFPTNDDIYSLCCGGDGYVYISCYGGMTFKGRGDNWKKIFNGGISGNFRDMVWHKDRVYCTNDYGLWQIQNDRVQRASLPDEIEVCAGHLYSNDGVMLMAGLGSAAYCEDGKWTLLYNSLTMDNLVKLKELEEKANTTQ